MYFEMTCNIVKKDELFVYLEMQLWYLILLPLFTNYDTSEKVGFSELTIIIAGQMKYSI